MSLPSVVTRIAPTPMRRTMSSPSCSDPEAAAGFLCSFKLLGLCHGPQIRLVGLEALRGFFLRLLLGHRGRYDHLLAPLPVHPRRHPGFGIELQWIEQAQELVGNSAPPPP